MPRIRKKTSKRGTTQKREKIKEKAAETRKKQKRAARKNVQWKSKHPKDLGIPNNFPYKDQILAEVAEERRKTEEEKQRRKDAKKANKAQAKAQAGSEEPESGDEGTEDALNGVTKLGGGTKLLKKPSGAAPKPAEVAEEDVPILINPHLPNLQAVLGQADAVIELLDARDPLAYRSQHVEHTVRARAGPHTLLVLNKIESCPREALASWSAHLRREHPTLLFRAASAFLPVLPDSVPQSKGKAKLPENDAWGVDAVLECLGAWAAAKTDGEPFTVAVVGLTNVGKSAFVNSLARRAALPVYKMPSLTTPISGPTTTVHPVEVTLDLAGRACRIIDTPGLLWDAAAQEGSAEDDDAKQALRTGDILRRNRGRVDRLRDPVPAVAHIVARAQAEDLMLFYSLPAFANGDTAAFLSGVARANGLVKKRGAPDLTTAARIVLRDWSTGKLPRYTTPAQARSASAEAAAVAGGDQFAALYAGDERILAAVPARKELRKAGGLVRLVPGGVDTRLVALEAAWIRVDAGAAEGHGAEEEAVDEEEEEEEEEDASDAEGAVSAEEDEDDDDDDEEPEEAPQPIGKRKRPAGAPAAASRPAKKVAFSAKHKGATQPNPTSGALKPALKAPSKTKPKPSVKAILAKKAGHPPNALKKTANAPKKASTAKAGEDAYDFGSFF